MLLTKSSGIRRPNLLGSQKAREVLVGPPTWQALAAAIALCGFRCSVLTSRWHSKQFPFPKLLNAVHQLLHFTFSAERLLEGVLGGPYFGPTPTEAANVISANEVRVCVLHAGCAIHRNRRRYLGRYGHKA